MIHRIFLGIVIFIVLLIYLSHLNPQTLELHLLPGTTFPLSMSLLIVSCIGIGAFLMMAAVTLRDTRKGLAAWREKNRLKKKEKIMDLYREGVNNLLSKKRESALRNFQKILESDPDHADALLRIGDVHRYNGDYPSAIQYHRRALSVSPQSLSVLFALAKDYRRSGQNMDAAETYGKILEIDPKNVAAFSKLRELYEKVGAWDKAYALQKGYWALKKNPQEKKRLLYYQFMTAEALDDETNQEKAMKLYSDLIKADKSFSAPYLKLGEIQKGQGQEKEAVKTWKKGFKETGIPVFLEALDEYYRSKDDPASIIQIYKEAIHRYPDDPMFKFLLGKSYYRLEMIDDALEVFEQLKHQGIRLPILQQMLADLYHKRGKTEEALLEYQKSTHFIRPVVIPYSCRNCGGEQEDWGPCCPACKELETLTIRLAEPEKAALSVATQETSK